MALGWIVQLINFCPWASFKMLKFLRNFPSNLPSWHPGRSGLYIEMDEASVQPGLNSEGNGHLHIPELLHVGALESPIHDTVFVSIEAMAPQ